MSAGAIWHVRLDPREVGASLAHMSDDEQGAALNAWAAELLKCCGTRFNAEMQLAYAASKLTPEARELFAMLGVP